jgi:superfamily II DNA/RNA helicase
VVNLDMPDEAQTYLHRAGRTGRAGRSGTAISIVTAGETQYIEKCEKALKITMQKKQMVRGEMADKNLRKPSPKEQANQSVKVKQPGITK